MKLLIDIPDKVYGLLKYFESSLQGFEPKDVKDVLIISVLNGIVIETDEGETE